jgi:hypothetical protein
MGAVDASLTDGMDQKRNSLDHPCWLAAYTT